ncbi:MAG: hypothetical protein CMJ65_08590 [Planctomycetaceae bacterium]|nr:hypothetical protein [Planctomycetaceae bacterium]
MRIAVTADVHLSPREDHPERLAGLRGILEQLESLGITTLLIAGDLFQSESSSYPAFEQLCRDFPVVSIHVIPGNHDPGLAPTQFAALNLQVHDQPTTIAWGDTPFLLVPFREGIGMGTVAAEHVEANPGTFSRGRWVLVGHGDYFGGLRERNLMEPGVYMPLTRGDLDRLGPGQVLIGHIHKPTDDGPVHYPGSPCPLNINETGRRRFLIYDTADGSVTSQATAAPCLFLVETLVLVPGPGEWDRLRADVKSQVSVWNLTETERAQVQIRIRVRGWCSDMSRVLEILGEELAGFEFHDADGPDLSRLKTTIDEHRHELVADVLERIKSLPWTPGELVPDRADLTVAALNVIFGKGD